MENTNNPETEARVARGQFSYTGDDGIPIRLTYTVEENGFIVQGTHLLTTPPVLVAIQRVLQSLALRYQTENSLNHLIESNLRNMDACDKGHKGLIEF